MTTSREIINQFREDGAMGNPAILTYGLLPPRLGQLKACLPLAVSVYGVLPFFITTVMLYDAEGRVVQV